MTRLALNGTRHMNGVSRIHGAVSARLCADQWPEVRPEDNPVGYVTNGVHVPTFLHQRWMEFFDRELGREWRERLRDPDYWQALARVPDERYWATAQDVKARMLGAVRERLQREYARKGLSPAQLRHVTRLLDPQRPGILTLGFARRFATYKRAALLLRDRARLARLVNDPERPVLLLFAGKAHPADEPGKAGAARDPPADDEPGVCRPHRVPRGLRPAAGAQPGRGRRRLAQQSDRAARGERHLRHQGGDQWPPQPEHPRRLVGRGLDAGQRLGHPARQRG